MLLPTALTILLAGTLIIKISTQIHSSFENLEPVKVENRLSALGRRSATKLTGIIDLSPLLLDLGLCVK